MSLTVNARRAGVENTVEVISNIFTELGEN